MHRSSAATRWTSLGISVFLFAGLAMAQERFGGLQGTVLDETEAVLPGVTVALTNKSTGRTITARSGAYGDYAVRNLEPGRYSITFELPGFSRAEFPAIDVLVAQNLKLNATLKPGAVTTTIQVTDVAPLVDLQSSSVVFHMPQSQFESLPKARTFQQMAILAPMSALAKSRGASR